VQGTIKEYDLEQRTGSLLTDDRTEIAIDGSSFGPEELLMLRFGQRVRFEVAEVDGRAVARSVRVVTFE
jgi:cold shock CspA family protein